MNKITCEDAVKALKALKYSNPAMTIAASLGTDSRSVATAMRKAVKDGRVTVTYKRGIGWYRFKKLTPNA